MNAPDHPEELKQARWIVEALNVLDEAHRGK